MVYSKEIEKLLYMKIYILILYYKPSTVMTTHSKSH